MNDALGNQGGYEQALNPSQELPSKGTLQKTTSISTFIPILILLLFSCAIYFSALFGGFVYDDKYQIVDNPWIKDVRNIPTIFSKSVWGFQPGQSTSNYYRPMMHIVYMLNYHLFGLKPWGFHLANILFHCGVSILVFLIIRRFLPEQRASVSFVYLSPPFIAALLFASHPIHTETVTWIAGLPDVAFTFFYLLSFYLYVSFRDGIKEGYLLSILSFSMAALFKEPALTLPVILIAYDYQWKKSDKTMLAGIKRYVPYVAVSSVYLLARYYALKTFAPLDFYPDLGTYQFIINVFPLFREYLTSLLWPLHLNVWHTFQPINSLFEAKGMISFVVTVIFCIVTVAAYRRNKVFFFGLLFLVVTLLPVFYIRGISGKPFAERYLYLPSLGYALLLATFLSWAKQKLPRAVRSVPIVFIVIVCLYTIATINRNSVWKNNMNLWSDTVEKSPDSAHVRTNLGEAYAAQGLWDRAMTEYQTALRLNPDYAQAHNNLGAAYASQGLWDRAMAEHQTAVRLNPDYAQAHNNLGNAYAAQGLWDRAMAEYQTVLRLNPDYAQAHYNLGAAYASQGLLDKAMAEYQTVLRLNPDDAQAHNNLGAAYASQGLLDRAMGEFKTALRLKPDYSEAEYNLAFIYLKKGNADMALREVEVILSIRPDFSKARELRNDIISRRH